MDGFVIVLYSFRRLLIDLTFDHLNELGPFTSIDCILKAPLLGLWQRGPEDYQRKHAGVVISCQDILLDPS